MTRPELAARLLASFLDELDEQLRVFNAGVLALERGEDGAEQIRSIFRVAHTLKGAARAAGVPLVEQVCHELESLLTEVRTGAAALTPNDFALLFEAADALADAGQRLRRQAPLTTAPLATVAARLASAAPRAHRLGGRTEPSGIPAVGAAPVTSPSRQVGEAERAAEAVGAPAAPGRSAAATADGSVRVPSAKLDQLVAAAATLGLSRGQAAALASETTTMERELAALLSAWRRQALAARRQRSGAPDRDVLAGVREAELALERLARRAAHVGAAATRHERTLAVAESSIAARMRGLRMRPFGDVTEPLGRVARDVAAAVGKEVQLEVRGTDVEADRAVLDRLREPLVQLVRNAIDHGIESPAERQRKGKPVRGTVTVSAAIRGDRLVVAVEDDGAGVDEVELRAASARSGRGAPDLAIGRLLLEGGLTTRREVSTISGRGVGLDVVRTVVEELGGTIAVEWVGRVGTAFTVDCPIVMARMRAVLVEAGNQLFALPAAHVERVQRTPRAALRRLGGRDVLVPADATAPRAGSGSGEGPIPVAVLAAVLGPPLIPRPPAGTLPIVVLNGTGHRFGIVVDELVGEDEVVVRPLPRGHALPPTLAGATLLPSGAIALVLHTASLARAAASAPELPAGGRGESAASVRRRVLVADDSITTRALEQSVLEGAGYDVTTAADGLEAWRLLEDGEFDLLVSDVEMPRMDGFTLCETIRRSDRLRALPVVLVTAREREGDRARGLEAGADAYIGKSGFDQQDLLAVVRDLLA